METRYYFIFTAAIILLQLLIYIFNKTLIWWLNKPLSQKARRTITFTSFLLPNVLVICHFLKLFTVFRLIALVLALLLFQPLRALPWDVFIFFSENLNPSPKLTALCALLTPFYSCVSLS